MKTQLLILSFLFSVNLLNGATYTVTSNVDGTTSDGVSLRWAITQANSNSGLDTIAFNIPGIAPQIIGLMTVLPNISVQNVFIDGSTQPPNGYTGPEPKIIVQNNDTIDTGFYFFANSDSKIAGVWVRNFRNYGIYLFGSAVHLTIDNCKLSNNGINGFYLVGSSAHGEIINSTICNNLSDGISIFGAGASATITNNLVSGNGGRGIVINGGSSPSGIRGNRVGTDSTGTLPFANSSYGIDVETSGDTIGGDGAGEGNVVAFNLADGIHVGSGNGNRISRNSCFCNNLLGINIGFANNGIAAPLILSATTFHAGGTATANSSVELFYDTSCTGCEGKTWFASVLTDTGGVWSYWGSIVYGSSITATQTDTLNNTSQFSICFQIITTDILYPNVSAVFDVFPNPANDLLNIHFNNLISPTVISIYNLVGEKLFENNLGEGNTDMKINTRQFAAGVYIVKAVSSTASYQRKMVIEK